jgi:hypothetical protein
MEDIVLNTDLKSLKLFKKGKVRDIYDLDDKLLIVATDRISAFDVVIPNGIPQSPMASPKRAGSSPPSPSSGLIFARTLLPTTLYHSDLPFSLSRKGSF